MLRCLGVVFAIGLYVITGVSSVSASPVSAFSQHDSAPVRSGPGEKFYETQQLQIGDAVEIYKTTDDGWCAIRPPVGSYSWVPADELESGDSASVMRVVRSGIRTRVGSLVSDDRNVKYVTLHKGEAVRSLGRSSDGTWVKIAPPSGEFRWIHKQYLGSRKPDSSSAKTDEHALASLEVVEPATIQTNDVNVDADLPVGTSVLKSEASPEPIGSSLISAAKPLGGDTQMSTVPMEPVKVDPPVSSDVAAPSTEQVAIDSPWKSRGAEMAVASPLGTDAGDYGEDLRQINMALSAIVAQETSKWQLASVRQRTENVIDTAQQPKQRDMARQLLKRITEFEDVKRRYDLLASDASPSVLPRSTSSSIRGENVELVAFLESNNRTADSRSNPTPTERTPAERSEEIAGSGWLMPVITTNPNMPKFALTDDEGQIEYFVSPEPNVNLKSYLRRRVSILGKSGFDSSLGKSHLAASKVVLQR